MPERSDLPQVAGHFETLPVETWCYPGAGFACKRQRNDREEKVH